LVAALMKRALEDVRRVLKIREEKAPLQQMVRDGVVGEDLWDKMIRAEQELEAELQQVMEEADIYRPEWSKTIFQEASQLANLQIQRIHQMEANIRAQEEAREKQSLEEFERQQQQQQQQQQQPQAAKAPNKKHAGKTDEDLSPTSAVSVELDDNERRKIENDLLAEEEREHHKAPPPKSKGKPAAAAKRGKKKTARPGQPLTTQRKQQTAGQDRPQHASASVGTGVTDMRPDLFLRNASLVTASLIQHGRLPVSSDAQPPTSVKEQIQSSPVEEKTTLHPAGPPLLDQIKERVFYAREEIQLALDITTRLIAARVRKPQDPQAIENQLRISRIARRQAPKPFSRIKDIQHLISSKLLCLRDASSVLARHAASLQRIVEQEQQFYGQQAFILRHYNWPLHPRLGVVHGAILYVDYGFSKAGSKFHEIAEADVVRHAPEAPTPVGQSNSDSITIVAVHKKALLLRISLEPPDASIAAGPCAQHLISYVPYALQGTSISCTHTSSDAFTPHLASGRLAVFEAELFDSVPTHPNLHGLILVQIIKELSTQSVFGRHARLSTNAFVFQLDHHQAVHGALSDAVDVSTNADISSRWLALGTRIALRKQQKLQSPEDSRQGIFHGPALQYGLLRLRQQTESTLRLESQSFQGRLAVSLAPLCANSNRQFRVCGWSILVGGCSSGTIELLESGTFACRGPLSQRLHRLRTLDDVALFFRVAVGECGLQMIVHDMAVMLGADALQQVEWLGHSARLALPTFRYQCQCYLACVDCRNAAEWFC
ncbi:Pre protein translocase subunit Sec66-domain-containing protein, partial [Entophlyctis helioformis]